MAKLEVLRHVSSREQWFRDMIRASARRLEPILEAAISGFVEAARVALDDGDQVGAAEYRRHETEYETDLAILRRQSSDSQAGGWGGWGGSGGRGE